MHAIKLDTPVRRYLGREAALAVGSEGSSPVACYAKDERSSTAFLVVDGEGARHCADHLLSMGPVGAERGELLAELAALCEEANT